MGQTRGTRIKVLCVDDHPTVREELQAALSAQPDIEVVAVAKSADQALPLFYRHEPDITIMDLKIHGEPGMKAITEIRRFSPHARIIVLTTSQGEDDIYRSAQAGAPTFLLKDMLAENLVRLVHAVHGGAPPAAEELGPDVGERPALTHREIEVLDLVAAGGRNKEVGNQLGIAEYTVQVHLKNIMAKLKVRDRTEAVTVALRRGILRLH